MIRTLLLAAAALAITVPAHAQNKEALCEFLPVQESFVSADYVPGVDVHGNPVVPADVKHEANGLLDVIKIPVTLDVANAIGQNVPGMEMDAQLGMIEIHKDSSVLLNGQDVTDKVYALCGKEPFNIEKASAAPEPKPAPMVVPKQKPIHEEIIWGEGY